MPLLQLLLSLVVIAFIIGIKDGNWEYVSFFVVILLLFGFFGVIAAIVS